MLILLPPSEGKSRGGEGAPVDPAKLVLPDLAPVRERVIDALTSLARRPWSETRAALGLSDGQIEEAQLAAEVRTAATATAADRYTGVLFGALDLPGLRASDPAAYAVACDSVLVFSGLWGVVAPHDLIPPYRCAMSARLPGLGPLASVWRGPLGVTLEPYVGDRLVADLRSSGYAAAWRPRGEIAERVVSVHVLRETVANGVRTRSVVSHSNKATKGALARALVGHLARENAPATPKDLAELSRDLGFEVELAEPGRNGTPWTLDVVT